jgi:hypothetical protein
MRYLKGFGQFWYDFIVGDDWKIAAAVVTAVGLGAVGAAVGLAASALFAPVVGLFVVTAFITALLLDTRHKRR